MPPLFRAGGVIQWTCGNILSALYCYIRTEDDCKTASKNCFDDVQLTMLMKSPKVGSRSMSRIQNRSLGMGLKIVFPADLIYLIIRPIDQDPAILDEICKAPGRLLVLLNRLVR